MSAAKLLNLTPTLVVATFLSCTVYSANSTLDDPAARQADSAQTQALRAKDAASRKAEAGRKESGHLRDPFQVVPGVSKAASEVPKDQDPPLPEPEVDHLAEIVQELRLDATFLQGRDQIAIIDGRVYSKGQHLLLESDSGRAYSPLFLASVTHMNVVLQAGGRRYQLGYPDQLGASRSATREAAHASEQAAAMGEIDSGGELALLKKLLDSSSGAPGKSRVGKGRRESRAGSRANQEKSPRAQQQ